MRVYILTLSDKGYAGEREDKSGELLKDIVKSKDWQIIGYEILPDEKELISKKLVELCDQEKADLILTTGGTGVSPRDVTPDATIPIIEKRLTGFEIAMMIEGLKSTPMAAISRAVVGTRKKTLIINLPGNPKAAFENLSAIVKAIPHAIEKLQGDTRDCGNLE
ncbi:MAG: MogA/MoaB family molybdenum cofactor biosynthesis protein [Thermotogae bacterium]|nr:MogA/MoaB family molybdenum cofactor biosynthesis protein [Thermotogota bacterium]